MSHGFLTDFQMMSHGFVTRHIGIYRFRQISIPIPIHMEIYAKTHEFPNLTSTLPLAN